jgi:Spermidine synthase
MEIHENSNVSLYLSGLEPLDTYKNELQAVQLYSHPDLGTVLVIDGEIQHVSKWNSFYHETLTHLPSSFSNGVSSALILGGGDLFAAYELLKYSSITKLVICEWDIEIIKLMKKHYNHALDVDIDSRVHYVFDDAISFVKKHRQKYDLIINDCFNLIEAFPREDIYAILGSMLTPEGICCDLIYRHIFDNGCLKKSMAYLLRQNHKAFSLVTVPEYPGALHLLSIWGNNALISQAHTKSLNPEHANMRFEYFNPTHISYYFYLPPYLKRHLTSLQVNPPK